MAVQGAVNEIFGRLRLVTVSCLTVDGERGRCLRLAHHVLCHAGVGAYISWGQTTDLQGVVLTDLVSGLKQVFMYQMLSNTQKNVYTQTHSMQRAWADNTDKSKQWIKQRQGEGEGGRYCVTKGDQLMSHTFLWAGHHRLSSSVRWELGRHGPRTWTLHFGPLTPPGCPGDVQSWDALYR